MNNLFCSWIFVLTAAIVTLSPTAQAMGPPLWAPGPQAASEQIKIPDSKKWTVEQAVVNLRSSDKGTRMAALRRMSSEPGENIRKWITEAAQYDPESRIRFEAVRILAKRKEQASLPILMYIGEHDKDDRVRTAARTAAGMGPAPAPSAAQPTATTPPPGEQPTATTPPPGEQPTATTPAKPQPEEQPKRYDADGNELPPGYLDGDEGTGAPAWGVATDVESVVDEEVVERKHSGFMPQLGYDGPMGSPRTTLSRTQAGLQIGVGSGSFSNDIDATDRITEEDAEGANKFKNTDFSLILQGSWSPIRFIEIGAQAEVLTIESSKHDQTWTRWNDDDNEWEEWDADDVNNDAGYKGAALGFLALDLKSVFIQTDMIHLGVAFRLTFPTHTGNRFKVGIGAPDLFLPTAPNARRVNETQDSSSWGIEPGVVASFSPLDGLTVFADFTYLAVLLKYTTREEWSDGTWTTDVAERSTTNMFLITHIGAQYRFLDDNLGVQVALSPAFYLGKSTDGGLAALGIIPGVSYRLLDMIDLALTLDVQAGGDAAKPFQCTGLTSNPESQSTPSTACGVGRRVGFALSASYEF